MTPPPIDIATVLAADWARSLLATRAAVSAADDALLDIPARDFAAIARVLSDDDDRRLLAVLAGSRLRERPFIANWPALVRWRDGVLRDRRKHTPDIIAAALEALALECTLFGYPDLAAQARENAERLVMAVT